MVWCWLWLSVSLLLFFSLSRWSKIKNLIWKFSHFVEPKKTTLLVTKPKPNPTQPYLWILEHVSIKRKHQKCFNNNFRMELSFLDHCVLALLQRFVQPFPVKNFAGSKTMLLRIYFARLGFSHSSFAGAEATSRLLLSKLTLRDFVQRAALRRLQSLLLFLGGKVQNHWKIKIFSAPSVSQVFKC